MLNPSHSRIPRVLASAPRYDLICVGGGPGNLALAEELKGLRSGASVLILELGRSVQERRCPLASHGVCPPCKLCHAVHGVAGAGAYSDGNVSFWPAGTGLLHLAGSLPAVHGVERQLTEIEHGVRLEMPHTVTERLAACHRDAKIKVAVEDGSEVRTFCLCQRGFVLGAYYDDMTTVSGYSERVRWNDPHRAQVRTSSVRLSVADLSPALPRRLA